MKSPEQIAEDVFPGWNAVSEAERSPIPSRPMAQYGTPDVSAPQRGKDVSTDFVEIEKGDERRVVIVSEGKVVAVQG